MPKCAMLAILAPLRPLWVKVRGMGCEWWVVAGFWVVQRGNACRKQEKQTRECYGRKKTPTHKNKAAIRKGM